MNQNQKGIIGRNKFLFSFLFVIVLGIFLLIITTDTVMASVNNFGITYDATISGQTFKGGYKILPTSSDLLITNITMSTNTNCTTAYITDSSKVVLTNATFVGKTATFTSPYPLINGTTYYLLADANGEGYSYDYKTFSSYPIVLNYFNVTAGVRGDTGEDTTSYGQVLDSFGFSLKSIFVILLFPTNNSLIDNLNVNFTANLSINNPNYWTNVTFDVWYSNGTLFNETTTTGLTGNNNLVFKEITLNYGNFLWNVNGCYNFEETINCSYATSNYSFSTVYKIENVNYNSSVYETENTNYIIGINSTITPSKVYLNYNDSISMASMSGINWTATKSLTSSNIGLNNFYWIFTINGVNYTSSTYNQTVNPIQFGLCNGANLTIPYINFSFKNEETDIEINGTIDIVTFIYYLGDGSITKSLIYSASTEEPYFDFCFIPQNKTLHISYDLQYSGTDYPQRRNTISETLTNATTNKTLYLLASADGIYTTIQVIDQDGNRLSDVTVTVERQFGGVWTVIGKGVTDDAGAVTFWVNPDYNHRFTFESSECGTVEKEIQPTKTEYTQSMSCTGGETSFISTLSGIKYARTPAEGIIQTGVTNFTYHLVSTKGNIINASFYLVNSSNSEILNSSVSTCSPSGCVLWFIYNITSGMDIKGRYYVDIGNGSVLLEGDAHWKNVYIPSGGKAGFKSFINDLKYAIDNWGDDETTDDFNRLVIIFLLLAIAISFFNYQIGGDSANPGAFITFLFAFILLGSLVGGTTGQGLFYFNNLSSSTFLNNYLLVFITGIMAVSYFLNVNRIAQR